MKIKDKWKNTSGDWALVTGGSSGIGLAISRRLASMKYNLLIVSIDPQLKEVGLQLHAEYGVGVHTLEMNLARHESAARLHDWCAANQIDPTILVNNAGIFAYNDLINTSVERVETIIGLHVLTTSMLSRLFGADMVKRGRGHILNLSSYSAWMPWPGLGLYSASKSYIRNFSCALADELRGTGVTSTTILPAGVCTDLYGLSPSLQKLGKNLRVLLTPEKTAEIALAAMFRGRRQYTPGLLMRLVRPLVKAMPGWAIRFARRKTLRFQK